MNFYKDNENNRRQDKYPSSWTPGYWERKRTSKLAYIAIALLAAILGSLITLSVVYMYLPQIIQEEGGSISPGPNITIRPDQDHTVYSAVAEKAMPSVVGITTVSFQKDIFWGTRKASGLGTGVIVDERGYILTNSHVVGDGNVEEVMVLLYNGDRLPAEVLWHEKTLDLAVIKVEERNLTPAELGDSDNLKVGEIAVAIGNPLGLNFERSLTQGVISGLNRSIPVSQGETIENLIQTDASINPGNSGGPLLNARGEVIGINTAKIQTGEGLGFAIPINTAKPIVDQFIEKGEFKRVLLGIRGLDVKVFEGLTGTELSAEYGVYIAEVDANSVAEKHGIQAGDIIVGVGDTTTKTMGELTRELYKYRPGDKATIDIMRGGQEIKIEVKL